MFRNLSKRAIGEETPRWARRRAPGGMGMNRRAPLTISLLASALAASACGSRLGTGELEAANGVLTRHSSALVGAAAVSGNAATGGGTVAAGGSGVAAGAAQGPALAAAAPGGGVSGMPAGPAGATASAGRSPGQGA